jgi:YVTN family beta-propeller protein
MRHVPLLILAACAAPKTPPAVAPAPVAAVSESHLVLVASKKNGELRIVDPAAKQVLATLPTGVGPHEIAVAPDRRIAVVANYGQQTPGSSLTVVSLAERSVTATIDLGEHKRPHGLSFLPDGRLAVTSEASQAVLLVDVAAGKVLQAIKTNVPGTHMVVTSADGKRAWTTNIPANSVSLLDLEKGALVKTVEVAPKVEAIALTPDGRELWVGSNDGNRVHVLDAETLAGRAQVPAAGMPIRVTVTPDGKHAIVSNAVGSKLQIIDTARREVVATIEIPPGPQEPPPGQPPSAVPIGTVVSPDSRTAYVSLTARGEVAVVDLATRVLVGTLPGGEAPDGIALVPN